MNYKFPLGAFVLTMTLIGSAAHAADPADIRQLLRTGDCPGCDLSDTTLSDLDLLEADLAGANLSGTRFQDVQLRRANLTGANLTGVNFTGTDLTGATLENADLSNATATFVCSSGIFGQYEDETTCFTQVLSIQLFTEICDEDSQLVNAIASASEAVYEELREEGSYTCEDNASDEFWYTYYGSYARLFAPNLILRGANLTGANLQNADFTGVDMSYATLNQAEAVDAELAYVRLFDADTTGLKNADLSSAWENWQALGEWYVTAYENAEMATDQREGQIEVESTNRAQQAYYLENGTFATDRDSLGLGTLEGGLFEVGIVATDRTDQTVQYALNQTGDTANFLGVVYVESDSETGENLSSQLVCESESTEVIPVSALPEIEAIEGIYSCPAGWVEVE